MKRSNWILVMLAAVVAVGLAGQANAFHDGGVAECSGCHSMHQGQASPLLVAQDKGSTCLSCHEHLGDTGPSSYHISTAAGDMPNDDDPPLQRSPGGDFGWLRKDLSEPASYGGGYVFIDNFGRENGHSIGAGANGYATEPGLAPGGTYSAGDLTCVSCHDPHGQGRITGTGAAPVVAYPTLGSTHDPIFDSGSYGSEPTTGEAVGTYRLLYGIGTAAAPSPVAYPGVPPAVVNSTYNRSEASTTTRVAYGYSATGTGDGFTSWGRWCGSCHPDMHTDLTTEPFVHKVDDNLGTTIATNYNSYVQTGDLTGVFPRGGPFTSLVPFAENTKSITAMAAKALIDDSDLSGPTASDRMTCMTCHRAHASAWKYALRWNGEAEFLTLGGAGAPVYPGTDSGLGNQGQFNRGYSVAQMQAAYYDRAANREFSAHQRSLCNKCHIKD